MLMVVLLAACSDRPLHDVLDASATPSRQDNSQVQRTPSLTQTQTSGTPRPSATSQSGGRLPTGELAVRASVETEPVNSDDDAADDVAIWYNRNNPGESRIIGTDKSGGGLVVYAMDGRQLQALPGRLNNVDLRYDFRLGNETITLVTASDRRYQTVAAFKMSDDGQLSPLNASGNTSNVDIYGLCMYRSPDNRYYAFVTEDDRGLIQQFEITANGEGNGVNMSIVRTFDVGTQSEGCVADDVHQTVYIGEEEQGIWRYGANPGDGSERVQVDSARFGGNLDADVEGLTIYYANRESGYLIASSQGNDSFVLYDRQSNAYIGTFRIVDGDIDGVSDTDGIDVSNLALGSNFGQGVFVVQDGSNRDAGTRRNQNFKLVPWESIANLFNPPLTISTTRAP